METFIAGLWAGYGLAVPVGAVAVLMINMTARNSFRHGASAAMGATAADAIYAAAAVLGGSALTAVIAPVATPLRWAAAIILVGMAFRIAVQALTRRRSERDGEAVDAEHNYSAGKAFISFFLLTALNPWPAIYFVALVLGRQSGGAQTAQDAILYVTAIVLASASWQLFLAGGGALLGRVLTSSRGRFITAVVSSGLITGLAISVATSG